MENLETIIMNIIVDSGNARSSAMEAIAFAKQDKFDEARLSLESARREISRAHHSQTDLIQNEAKGIKTTIGLFMVHAQDHLMTAMAVIDLAQEFVDMYEKISKK